MEKESWRKSNNFHSELVLTSKMKLTEFYATVGVCQGCIVSPLTFIILMDDIWKGDSKSFDLGNWQLKPVKISQLAFADDLVLLLKSEEDLKHNLNVWYRDKEMRNIKISINKN